MLHQETTAVAWAPQPKQWRTACSGLTVNERATSRCGTDTARGSSGPPFQLDVAAHHIDQVDAGQAGLDESLWDHGSCKRCLQPEAIVHPARGRQQSARPQPVSPPAPLHHRRTPGRCLPGGQPRLSRPMTLPIPPARSLPSSERATRRSPRPTSASLICCAVCGEHVDLAFPWPPGSARPRPRTGQSNPCAA